MQCSKHHLKTLKAVALLSLLSMGAVSADTMVVDLGGFNFTNSQLINATVFNGTFQQFNPALGTLTSVALGWSNQNLETFLDATAGNTGGAAIAGNAVNYDNLALPGASLPGFFFQNTNFSCSVPGSEEVGVCDDPITNPSLGNSDAGQLLSLTPSILLSVYTGTGTLGFSVTPQLSYATTTDTGSTSGVNDNVGGQDINNAQDLFLIYTYTPAGASTPEPGSIVLLAAGLGLLWLYRKAFQIRTMAPAKNPRSA